MLTLTTNAKNVERDLRNVQKQMQYATVRTANVIAFGVRDAMYGQFRKRFSNPTPWTMRSIEVIKATKANPAAYVQLRTDQRQHRALGHHFVGGNRDYKRMEGRLYRSGILRSGQFAIAGAKAPRNTYGNIRPSFVTKLLSYFDTLEMGNMGVAGRAKVARRGRTRQGYIKIGGREYFVSFGKTGRQHLRAGIWSKKGIHGVQVEPMLMFTRGGTYGKRFDWLKTANAVIKQYQTTSGENALFLKHFREAMDTAK